MGISIKAYAKINWALDIVSARDDGYHELDMLMQLIELHDDLHFEHARWTTITINGKLLPVGNKNLVVKAADALNHYMGKRNSTRVTLKKVIPVRAGLGGGSADCAAALIALNKLWKYNICDNELLEIGASLGSDVPFCMKGIFARVRGRGEVMEPLTRAPRIPLVIVQPDEGLSTADVFGKYDEIGESSIHADIPALANALSTRNLLLAQSLSANSLEAPAIALLPQILTLMDKLRLAGAEYVRMTGSGSCVFGAFSSELAAQNAARKIKGAILTRTLTKATNM